MTTKTIAYLFLLALCFAFVNWSCKSDKNLEKSKAATPTPQEMPLEIPIPDKTGDVLNTAIPACFVAQIENGEIKSVYSYTFGEEDIVYLVSYTKDTDGTSTLFDSSCAIICTYLGSENVWNHPCASFPSRSSNETFLYSAK